MYNAISTSSPKKAPGTDKLSFAILRRAYNAESKVFYLLYRALFAAGYYPKGWREAIGVILPKANKKDYSLPKAYRVISLLNCLGKAFKKILATRRDANNQINQASGPILALLDVFLVLSLL